MAGTTTAALVLDAMVRWRESEGPLPEEAESLPFWVLGLYLAATVFSMRLLHRLWSAVPPWFRSFSPIQAWAFLLIPGFNVYWGFRVYPSLADALERWHGELRAPWSCVYHAHLRGWGMAAAVTNALATALIVGQFCGVSIPLFPELLFWFLVQGVYIFYCGCAVSLINRPAGMEVQSNEWLQMAVSCWPCIILFAVVSQWLW